MTDRVGPSGSRIAMQDRIPWYRCRVGRGLLPGEFTVIGHTADGIMFSLVAHHTLVDLRGEPRPVAWDQWSTGFLRLRWAEQKDNFTIASLPVPAVQQGSYVRVPCDRVEWVG